MIISEFIIKELSEISRYLSIIIYPIPENEIQLSVLDEHSIARRALVETGTSVCSIVFSVFSPIIWPTASFLFFLGTGDGFRGYSKVANSATIPHADMIRKSPW